MTDGANQQDTNSEPDHCPVHQPPISIDISKASPKENITYHVSKRISLSFLIASTVLFSVIFSSLRALEAPYQVYIAIIALVTLSAVLQAFLGKSPRIASAVAGVFTFVPWFIYYGIQEAEHPAELLGLPCVAAFAALAGYLAGGLAAGVILLLDKIERQKK